MHITLNLINYERPHLIATKKSFDVQWAIKVLRHLVEKFEF